MATDFTGFTLYTNSGLGDGVSPLWYGWGVDHTPGIWLNLSGGAINGVLPNQLSLHPGNGTEPSVLRWTSPTTGYWSVTGAFLPGDSGTMQVGVRTADTWLWQATDQGSFDLVLRVAGGATIDFAVYGGYAFGSTPVAVTVSDYRPEFTGVVFGKEGVTLGVSRLVIGATNDLQYSTTMSAETWTNLISFTSGAASTNVLDEAVGEDPIRFYRLIVH